MFIVRSERPCLPLPFQPLLGCREVGDRFRLRSKQCGVHHRFEACPQPRLTIPSNREYSMPQP